MRKASILGRISRFDTDPWARSLTARVVSCEPDGRGRFAVVLDDTVFYPESGGQPSDRGTVGGIEILALGRDPAGDVVHTLPGQVSGEVDLVLDWERRFDHMQQHTAQHILSCLALKRFGWRTTAFHLGESRSDIELEVPSLRFEDLEPLEQAVNEAILENRPVTARFVAPCEVDMSGVRSRRLPRDLKGDIRLVEIEGLDCNNCGGTHVSATGQVQILKISGTEQLRGGTRVFYIAGGRALAWTGEAMLRERRLSRSLTCSPAELPDSVDRLLERAKESEKAAAALSRELAALAGAGLASGAGIGSLHREDPDMEFLRAAAAAATAAAPGCRALLTGGRREGVFLLMGPPDWTERAGPVAAGLLEGRGGGRGGTFQGRASRLDRREEALEALARLD